MTDNHKVKSILKKETPQKRVSFGKSNVIVVNDAAKAAASEDDAKNKAKSTSSSPRPKAVRLTRAGERVAQKGKAKPLRDLGVFLGILAILMYSTRNFEIPDSDKEAVLVEEEDEVEPNDIVSETLNSAADRLVSFITKRKKWNAPRTADCAIFVNRGAMPRTGYSLFAGQDYAVGERIDLPIDELLPIAPGGDAPVLWSPAHAFLIKHHPSQANVEGRLYAESPSSLEHFELVATRPIEAREELFVEYKHHPATVRPTVFGNIPSAEEHELAEELAHDAKQTANKMKQVNRKMGVKLRPEKYVSSLLRRSIEHFNPRVAALLAGGPYYTMDYHRLDSTCLDDMKIRPEDDAVVAGMKFPKGHTISYVPIYKFDSQFDDKTCHQRSEKKECAAPVSPKYCFAAAAEHSTIVYCPLTTAAGRIGFSAEDPNVDFEWIGDGDQGESYSFPGTLAWRLVTRREIEAGEVLKLKENWREKLALNEQGPQEA